MRMTGRLVVRGRSPKIDLKTEKPDQPDKSGKQGEEKQPAFILGEESIKVFLTYLDQLKKLFTNFVHTNFNAKRKVWPLFYETDMILGPKLEGN